MKINYIIKVWWYQRGKFVKIWGMNGWLELVVKNSGNILKVVYVVSTSRMGKE